MVKGCEEVRRIVMKGDRKMYLHTRQEQRVLSLLTAWCSHKTFSLSYQLNLISNLRSFKQRPIFKNRSAVAMPFLASQKWKAIVAHLPPIGVTQVWGANGQQFCCTCGLGLIMSVLWAWNKMFKLLNREDSCLSTTSTFSPRRSQYGGLSTSTTFTYRKAFLVVPRKL